MNTNFHKSDSEVQKTGSAVRPVLSPQFSCSFDRLDKRLPLTLKTMIVTILVGLAVWGILDEFQSHRLKSLFHAQLKERLAKQAMKDRISFDHYVKTHLQSVKLFVSQKRFSDYVEKQNWSSAPAEGVQIQYHTRPPGWFPDLSVLRRLANPRYAILLDFRLNVREVYKSRREMPPLFLLKPSPLLLAKSNGQNFISRIEGVSYIISSKSYFDSRGNMRATLMLASLIDDEFLGASLGGVTSGHIVALITSERDPHIIMSSNVNEVPPGMLLKDLRDSYLITGQEFFDYGASEQAIKFVSLISTEEVDSMTQSVISRGRQELVITVLPLIFSCVLIMLWVTRRIQNLTRSVTDFSKKKLGKQQQAALKGDQLYVLEERFRLLTEEVLEARDVLNKEAEERLFFEKKNMEIEQKEKQLMLLQSVTQAIGVGVITETPRGLSAVNKQMERFAEICGGLSNFETGRFEDEERTLLDEFGDQHIFHISSPRLFQEKKLLLVRDITKEKKQKAALEHLAMHDALTGLPNRALLRDRLQQAIFTGQRDHERVALLMMDLDRFKEINDTLGHHIGDMMLIEAGNRLPSVLRKSDTIARLGGDEFAVVLPKTGKEFAKQIARQLLDVLSEPFIIEDHSLYIAASIGIVCFPDQGEDVRTLLQRADVAMYVAKNTQSGLSCYSPDHDQHSLENLVLMSDLRRAIESEGLELYFQPKICCAAECVEGMETLVRWRHPEHGFIRPDLFIPIAEHTGLIKPLTMWVLNTALRQYREWQKSGSGMSARMSVNLSARNLLDLQFPGEVNELLKKWDLEPGILELEITESAVMVDPEHAMKILVQLDELGVQLSIDDFGTGYTSLGYLKKLPVDVIKIDKSFVMNMIMDESDAMIVRSTIDLAHNLGLSVIAEGVESEEILTALKRLGCDGAQGYHICRPVPASDFIQWFHNSQTKKVDKEKSA